jgi:Rps23 Pro-64 3,4-dihydroxylase Tpa1-like proline 4-hydroxylase
MLNLHRIAQQKLETEPYQWALIDQLFSIEDAATLAASFPRDKFKKVKGYDGEKSYEYMSRSLVHMGASVPTDAEGLSPAWRALAGDLLSAEYHSALQKITGVDLSSAPMEVNVIHYGPGAFMGPHVDLKAKIMTHVLYFNETWDQQQGGCIHILKSSNPANVLTQVLPVVGNSVLLVRSKKSWHSVSRVAEGCSTSRRSLNVIFHRSGSVSTMWPPGDSPVLQDYAPAA